MANSNDKAVLVTGGSGFVALQCIQQLLDKRYKVRTTLRSLKKKQEVLDALKDGRQEQRKKHY
jgi:nucleoside-diphosphate-sugar epimerase